MSDEVAETIPGLGKAPSKDSYFEQSRDLPSSLILVLPALLFYELGLLWSGGATINGVDFITIILARRWGPNGLLVFNGLLFLAGIIGLHYLKRNRGFDPRIIGGVLIESTVYAMFLGTVILWIMSHIPGFNAGLDTGGAARMGVVDAIFISLGAGINEELVFRLLLYSGLAWSFGKFTKRGAAVAGAVVVSSLLFSLAHYAGGESFQAFSFVYRFLAGAIFCGLFVVRGFAVAVYTHAIYDIYVLVSQVLQSS
jgi:membrane protease YdiL (CAAX protease family)